MNKTATNSFMDLVVITFAAADSWTVTESYQNELKGAAKVQFVAIFHVIPSHLIFCLLYVPIYLFI